MNAGDGGDWNVLDAIHDENLFRPHFKDLATWNAWRVWLAALFGLPPPSPEAVELYRQHTGRAAWPTTPVRESWLICGRRSGKSFTLAIVASYLAAFRDYSQFLAPGERATIMVLAADRRQARTIFGYVRALLQHTPLLQPLLTRETRDVLDLSNGVSIEITTASFKSVRGYTLAAVLCDELSFWGQDESTRPDVEILAALRPSMLTIPGSLLLVASSPYAKKGEVWRMFRDYYGRDDDAVLVWKSPSKGMNPTLPQWEIDRLMRDDPNRAASEYLSEFRNDIMSFVDRDVVEAAVMVGVREIPPSSNVRYFAFCDPSGGSQDAMTLAIAHRDGATKRVIIDALRERQPPFSPDDVTAEFAELLRRYRVTRVQGDRYAGAWPSERFKAHRIIYEAAAKPKSDLYRDLLPRLNSGEVELLDHPRLVHQLCNLERRTARGGRDSIDHPQHGHDDVANAVAGAIAAAFGKSGYGMLSDEVLGVGPADWAIHPILRG